MTEFPIMGYFSRPKWEHVPGTTIPWAMIAPHEGQARRNHCGQTLQRLAERGGLSACEAIAVLEDRRWQQMDQDDATATLKAMVERWKGKA